jgi:cytidyltransferase-like protein
VSLSVLIGGVFDPLHAGHLAYIREAQKHGPARCVLSNNRRKHPPLLTFADRIAWLSALSVEVVECVENYCDEPTHIARFLEAYRPAKYIKGKDWEGKLPAEEVAICQALGIEIIYTDTVTQSSSALLADYERKRNAEKLGDFERFVRLMQRPATKPWEPVTDYSFEARKEIEGPHAQIIKDAFAPRMVLDVGCGPCHLLRMLRTLGVEVRGTDTRATDEGVLVADVTDPWEDLEGVTGHGYDLVICREVLEHLTVQQIAVAVRNLVKLSTRFVYVTTRFTAKSHLLDVDASDDLDPTHITMLNQDFLRTLFVLEGCTRRPDLEEKLDHLKKGRVLVYEVPHD